MGICEAGTEDMLNTNIVTVSSVAYELSYINYHINQQSTLKFCI